VGARPELIATLWNIGEEAPGLTSKNPYEELLEAIFEVVAPALVSEKPTPPLVATLFTVDTNNPMLREIGSLRGVAFNRKVFVGPQLCLAGMALSRSSIRGSVRPTIEPDGERPTVRNPKRR